MSFFNRLLGGKATAEQSDAPVAVPSCRHSTLTAKWDSVQDMGNEEKATSWVCATCGDELTPAVAAELRGHRVRPAA